MTDVQKLVQTARESCGHPLALESKVRGAILALCDAVEALSRRVEQYDRERAEKPDAFGLLHDRPASPPGAVRPARSVKAPGVTCSYCGLGPCGGYAECVIDKSLRQKGEREKRAPFEVGQAVVYAGMAGAVERIEDGYVWANMANGRYVHPPERFRQLDLTTLWPCKPGELKVGDRVVSFFDVGVADEGLRRGHVYTIRVADHSRVTLFGVDHGWAHGCFARLPEVEP